MEYRSESTLTRRADLNTLEFMVSQMVKVKRRELFLLLCYVAVLIPTAAGRVLCLDCCCADQSQIERQACCCCAETEVPEPACCDEEEQAAQGSGALAFACPTCDCTLVPYSTDAPQLAERTDSQATSTPGASTAFSPHSGPENPLIPYLPSGRAQTDIGRLRTVILLI